MVAKLCPTAVCCLFLIFSTLVHETVAKKGHKIIVTSGSKKQCGCHTQKVPVPVPVPVPVHVHHPQMHHHQEHHGHGHGHGGHGGYGGFGGGGAYHYFKKK